MAGKPAGLKLGADWGRLQRSAYEGKNQKKSIQKRKKSRGGADGAGGASTWGSYTNGGKARLRGGGKRRGTNLESGGIREMI